MVLWRKSDLSYLSHFETQTSRLHEQKNAVYCFQMSLFVSEIFKFLKYANWPSDDVIHSTRFCSNMMKRDISANLYQTCLILCSKILLNVLFNTSLTVPRPKIRFPEQLVQCYRNSDSFRCRIYFAKHLQQLQHTTGNNLPFCLHPTPRMYLPSPQR